MAKARQPLNMEFNRITNLGYPHDGSNDAVNVAYAEAHEAVVMGEIQNLVPIIDLAALKFHTFQFYGELTTGVAHAVPFVPPMDITIYGISGYIDTAPTGAAVILDLHGGAGGGTTYFTTQANRPQCAASANAIGLVTPDVDLMVAGSRNFLYIDQVGSTVKGSNMTVNLVYLVADLP